MARQGLLVEPYQRLKPEQLEQLHQASLVIMTDPGIEKFIESEVDVD